MNIIFLGAANPETGRMIKSIQRVQGQFNVLGFIDNDPKKKGTAFLGYPVFGGFEMLDNFMKRDDAYFVNLITGSTRVRYETSRLMAQKGCRFANFIHPSVDLTMTTIGQGNYIQEGVILQAGVCIGNNSSIHIGGLVGHETVIGHSVFIAHASSISGRVVIEDGAFIGTNATVLPRIRIGKWATIGAGSVIIRDVPDYATVVGNPGKVIKVTEAHYQNADIFEGLG